MSDESTAIRHPRRGKAHRSTRSALAGIDLTICGAFRGLTERVPLSSVPTTDLCRTCWPTTKDVTP